MNRILKKLSLVFVVMTLCVSVFSCFSVSAAEDASVWTAREKAEGTVRFAVLSDSHLIKDTSRLDLAFQTFTNIGGFDGMMMVGDIVYMEKKDILYPERYTLLNETINKYDAIKNIPNAYVMGNHEYPQGTTDTTISQNSQAAFIEGIGLNTERNGVKSVSGANAVYEMGGYTVVAASPEAYSNEVNAETEAWAKAAIEAAVAENPDKPVFYLQHQPLQNTVYSSSNLVNSSEFVSWIKTQKNVINFTAHCHYSAYDPRSIWQSEDGFTSIHSAVLGGGYMGVQGTTFERENITDSAYAFMVEIDKDDVVKVYKLDLYNGEFVTSPYVIDVKSDERLYTDARYENVNVPEFQNNEAITVDNVTGHSVTVTFPDSAVMTETVPGVSNDTYVQHYKVQAINKITGEVSKSVSRYGDFWTKNGYDTRTVTINKLDRNTEYEIRVVPFSPLNNKAGIGGTPITAQIKTTNEKDATDKSLITKKRINVAMHKKVTASAPDETYKPSNLTDDNRRTFVIPADQYSANDDWFMIDLEKRYIVDTVEIYDRYDQEDDGGRRALAIEGSNDPDAAKWDIIDTLADGSQNALFPDNGCFTAKGNGKAYRYIRVRRTGGYYYGYSEIKVWANQDVTEVTRNRNAFADNVYSSSVGLASKAVNGTVADSMDAWISEQGGKYHFLTVDMETPKNIGLIEMAGRNQDASTQNQRNYWLVYGSDALAENSVLTDNATLNETETGYTKLMATGSVGEYIPGEYIFPEYPGQLQQVVSDSSAYRYLTFKRGGAGGAGSTYLGEARGFVLNPMVNAVTENNGIITVDFSDTMDASTINNDTIKIYDGATEAEIAAEVVLSDDKYTATVTPVSIASFYKISVSDDVLNLYGTDLREDYEYFTSPQNIYEGFSGRKDIYANVAMGKPITSSLSSHKTYLMSYANDGMATKLSIDSMAGTAIINGKGYVQFDLQNRYNLELIQYLPRQDLISDAHRKNLKVLASNDPLFKTYDTLDSIGSKVDDTKLVGKGIWNISLDGTKDYRYIRVEHTTTGEWSIAELRAYAKFDAISLTKNATADSYYQYHKTYSDAANYAPQKVLDGNTSTFHYVYVNGTYTEGKPKTNYTYLQVDLKNPYHVGYAELVARNSGHSGNSYYQHFDLYGSLVGDTVTDDNMSTHAYLNTKYLENVSGYTKLHRILGKANYSATKDDFWPITAGGVYKISLNDSEAYRYITHKTNSMQVGVEMSEMRLYSIAQRVNRLDVADDGKFTLNFAGSLIDTNATEDKISLYDKYGKKVEFTDFTADGYTISFIPSCDLTGGKIVVSKDIMNQYAVPMAADYEHVFPLPEVIENASLKVGENEATALTASTEYTFTATYNNNYDSEKSVYAYIVLRDADTEAVKLVGISEAAVASGTISAKLTTGENVDNCEIDVYIWYDDMKPIEKIKYFEVIEVTPPAEETPAVPEVTE